MELFDYIETFYNQLRRRSTLVRPVQRRRATSNDGGMIKVGLPKQK